MLKRFYNSIENILKNCQPLQTQLRQLRDLVRAHLIKEDFRLDCVEEMLASIHHQTPRFFYHDELKFSVRIITWPAFYENNPHQHKTWSVTGVVHNQLDICTFRLLENPKRLHRDRAMTALSGEAGFLMPGCIHRVSNPSHQLSASLHIFNNLDINNPEENAIWYPAPKKFNLKNGMTERIFILCVQIAANCKSERALSVLNQIYQVAPLQIKLMAIQAIYHLDTYKGNDYLRNFTKIWPASIHHSNDPQF